MTSFPGGPRGAARLRRRVGAAGDSATHVGQRQHVGVDHVGPEACLDRSPQRAGRVPDQDGSQPAPLPAGPATSSTSAPDRQRPRREHRRPAPQDGTNSNRRWDMETGQPPARRRTRSRIVTVMVGDHRSIGPDLDPRPISRDRWGRTNTRVPPFAVNGDAPPGSTGPVTTHDGHRHDGTGEPRPARQHPLLQDQGTDRRRRP